MTYFDREVRLRELDRVAVQQFVDWLTTRPGRDGGCATRSIANALTPLRLTIDAAVADGLLDANPAGRSCFRAGALAVHGRRASAAISHVPSS